MHPRHAHDGEASSLPAGAVACVRLRMSATDQLLTVLRWTLGLAGAVVALWFGSALLAVSPAAAAVPVVAAQAGIAKAGFSRPAAATDDGDDSGSSDDSGDSDDSGSDSDSGDKSSDDSGDESEDSDDSEDSDSDKGSRDEDRSDDGDSEERAERSKDDKDDRDDESAERKKKESASSEESGGDTSEKKERDSDEESGEQSDPERDERPADDAASDDAVTDDDAADEQSTDAKDAEEDAADRSSDRETVEAADESGESDEQETGRRGEGSSDDESDVEDRTEEQAVQSEQDDAAESTDEEPGSADDADDTDLADDESAERDLADGDLSDGELSDRDSDDSGERTGDGVEKTVARLVDTLTDDTQGDESGAGTGERSDDEDDTEQASEESDSDSAATFAAEAVRAALEDASDSDDSRPDADEADWEQLITEAADELDTAGDPDTNRALVRTEEPGDPRGPPADAVALFSSDEGDDEGSRESDEDEERDDDRDDEDHDDSPELTERVLEDRIEVDESKEDLEREKDKVASGESTQADYDEKAAEHAELEKRAAENRAEASEDDVELVDEVVDGHRELSEREKDLAAEEEQVASGAVDRETHEENVADYEDRRDDVYEATDELMDATDREVRTVSEDDLDGEGATAGCDSDGAFQACGSVSESADGERDSDRRLCLSGVSSCGASSESGGSKAEASCDDSGCGSSASSRGADGTETRSSARCDGEDCGQSSTATREGASAECESAAGTCRSGSSGSGRDSREPDTERDTVRLAAAEESTETRVAGSGSAECESATGCGTSSKVEMSEDGDVVADAETGCETGCTGSARTSTDASVVTAGADTRESATGATADCTVDGGSCSARSASQSEGEDGDASASSTAGGSVDCDAACTGSATGATRGKATGSPAGVGAAAPVRETSGTSSCTATSGGCAAESASEVGDAAAAPESRSTLSAAAGESARELYATSAAGATVACAIEGCAGRGSSASSGAASGDVPGVRDSTGSSSCTAHGAGGTCSTTSDTSVSDREPVQGETVAGVVPVSGPVSVSQANASVECAGAVGECGGTATAATSARDTAVTPDARGTSASTECTVTGGGCTGSAGSAASSANDFVATDPNTGLPLPGQPASGPSSTATASASLACAPGTACTGSVRTSTAAWDGAVTRTSDGTASCTGATGGCEVRSVSTASSSPGAALALSGGPQQVNAARLPAGPSAASAAGAAMTCAGEIACTGSVSSAATATDPSVSPTARGSHGEGSCEGVTGGVCQAVTNSGASSDPSANVITPLVAERSTANATVSSGTTGDAPQGTQPQQEQPAAPAPAAPGSSANSGAPTVPGASSWTMANATLDCSGSGIACTGVARSSAAGTDGPIAGDGANGSRGPPAGGSTTSGSCATGATGCRAQTSATAASGQVVADIVAEQQNTAAQQAEQQAIDAEQLAAEAARVAARKGATPEQRKIAAEAAAAAEQARKAATEAAELAAKPVADAPATMAQSSASAECAGQGCVAATTGGTSGIVGTSPTDATCTAAQGGCAVTSDASVMLIPSSGQVDEHGKPIRGHAGSGETGSSVICPDAGCTGEVSGRAAISLEQGGLRSASAGEGTTACDGSGPCQAGIRITASAAAAAPGAKEEDRFLATAVSVAASCDNGTTTGCAVHTTSGSDATGAEGVHATSTAVCTGGAGCLASTGGTASPDVAQVSYECTGVAGCTGHSEGTATADKTSARAGSDCRADGNGQCAGSATVGASTDGSAMAGASCEGTAGATCRFHFEASAAESSRDGSSSAEAFAHGSMTGEMGGGAVQVMAQAHAEGPGAQAQAMCQGTAGVKCGYHFEATASASARDGASWAKAYAHGSETGEMGGGAVQVMAQASAGGSDAQAQAMCLGAKNCTSQYSAHAEAHDRLDQKANPGQPDMPTGYWSADGAGTCRGSGNGGCGVHAWANAGPGGSGGATCSGDCSGFVQEQGGPSTFTKTGPSWNEMQAARRVHQVKSIDEVIEGLQPDDSFIGYKEGEDGFTIYTKDAGGQVQERFCPAAECKPGHTIPGGNGQITFQEQGNPQTSQQSKPGHADHTCNANVGCALTNHGDGNSDYWLEGEGEVHDGITGSTMTYPDNQPVGGGPAHRNEGSFGNTKGKPFTFTCNGGCQGSVSNIDLGKGKFTDQIDLEGTPNLLIGRDGLGNLGDYNHAGSGTITLMNRDGSMMEPIISGNDLTPQLQETSGLTPEEWADVVTKYGHTPWDLETVSRVLEPGDSLIGYRENADGNYTIYVKEPNGEVVTQECPADRCRPGGEVTGGRGKVAFPSQGDPTASQTSAPGRPDNTCTASISCGLATDGNGNGMWWMQGNGNVHDGISGSGVTYQGNPAESRNGGNWSNSGGTPFTASCADGCTGDIGFGDKKDHLELDDATGVLLTSRDSFGNAGRITWAGKGHYISAEGDKVWADLSKVAYDVDNEAADTADDTTLIVTRDAAGNPGYYALPTGQTGRIETIEGYVVDNRHDDWVGMGDFRPEDAAEFGHVGDTLQVTTPNGDGKGGVLACVGRCSLTGPGLDTRNTPCEACSWTEHLATGEGPHPGGWREVYNSGEAKTWYTPTGDELTCDGCAFVQYNRDANGNGGGAVCTGFGGVDGVGCSGKSREGTEVSDPAGLRMLYANADGSHQGYSCQSNSDSCGNRPELQFDWKGDPDETWALVLDPDYRRPSTGTRMDKDLAEKLGLDEDNPLPPLTADALAYLEKTDPEAAERYKLSLPEMSLAERSGMGFTYLEQQSTDRRLQQQYGPIYDEKIKPVLDAYRTANADNTLDPVERSALEERFKALDGIDPGLIYEWSSARGVIDGVDDATWVRPEIKEIEAQLGANPEMVEKLAGPEPTRLQDPLYGMTPMERALENARRDLGVDLHGDPNTPYNVNQNAMLSFRPRQTALDLTTAGHMREVASYNRQADAFNDNPVSAAEQQRLADWKSRLDQQWNATVGQREALAAATADLKGPEDQARQDRLRGMDVIIGRATEDDLWSDRLALANEQLTAIQEMRDGLDRDDPQQKKWAETLDALGGLASLNYTAISRNPEEREDGNPLGRLSLPSTGKADFYFAMVSGKNLPEYDNYQGGMKEFFTSLSRDELADLASYQSPSEYESGLKGRALHDEERPEGDVLKAIEELGGKGYSVDAERMLYRHGGQRQWQPMLVYRVRDKDGNVVGFVDLTGADFDSLTDYRNANVLPDDSHIITREDWGNPDSALTMTTAHHTSALEWTMDYVVAPGAIIAGVVTAPFVPPVGGALIAAGTGYYVGKAVGNVIVRAQHGQSNGFDNPAAVADYVTLGASAFFGVGSLVRPIATTAAGAALRGAAATALGGMTAYSAVDTALSWDSMTPGQRRNSIIGLAEGGVMLLTPLAARGVGAVFKPGTMPGQMWAGRNQNAGGTPSRPGLTIPSITLPRGRPTTPQLSSLGTQVRSVLEQLGSVNGRGGRIMTSAEVTAALRARGVKVPDEAALRDAINSTPGIDYVGDPSIGGIVRTGAGEFAGMRMSLDGPSGQQGRPTRQQVADVLDRAGWPEATRRSELAETKVQQLSDPVVFREVEATMKAQEAGRIVGMKDWLQYNATKAPKELAEAAAELSIARRLAAENPGMVVKVGLENRPRYKEEGSSERLKEFDIALQTPAGKVVSNIEVKTIQNPVKRPTDLTEGVTHAVEKVENRMGTAHPVEGSAEARINIKIGDGIKKSSKQRTEILKDGTVIRTQPDGTFIGESNIYDTFAQHLTDNVPRSMLLDRVTVVDQYGQSIVFVRQGSTWTRQ